MAVRTRGTVTVVLVHGAFSGPSLWSPVLAQLREAGVPALAAANPLRRLTHDASHIAEVAGGISGRVLLAGHAYGGAVITSAAGQIANAIGLIYVAGHALDSGESVADVAGRFPVTRMASALRQTISEAAHAMAEPAVAVDIEPASFPEVFAGDVSGPLAAEMAVSQRPVVAGCLTDRMLDPAWRNLPSWYLVAADDQCLHPEAQRFMARRAGSHTSETAGSHAVAVSQPTAVADILLTAAHVLG